MTLSLLALWFLCCERRRVGGKTPTVTVSQVKEIFARRLRVPAPSPGRIAEEITRAEAEGGGEDLPLARGDQLISAKAAVTRYELNACQSV